MPNSRFYDNLAGFSDLKYEAGNLYGRLNGGNYILIPTQGADGDDGDSAYVYHAFASDSSGTGFTLIDDGTLAWTSWITTNTPIANPSLADFTVWVRRKGIDGSNGADGTSAYVYVAWASDASGTGFSLTPSASLPYRAELHTSTPIVSPTLADFSGVPFVDIGFDVNDVALLRVEKLINGKIRGAYACTATGSISHAEGFDTHATGEGSHSEGLGTNANGEYSHTEGSNTTADGYYSHAEGNHTTANRAYQLVVGRWNVLDTAGASVGVYGDYAFIVGNGSGTLSRSNAFTVSWSGNIVAGGTITDGSGNVLSSKLDAPTNSGSAGQYLKKTSDGSVWDTIRVTVPTATTSAIGGAYRATDAEVSAGTSTSVRIFTPKQLKDNYAKTDLSNLTAHTAIDTTTPVDFIICSNPETNGYVRIWKSGWVEQFFFNKKASGSSNAWTAFNFYVAFASEAYSLFDSIAEMNSDAAIAQFWASYKSKSSTGFTARLPSGSSRRDFYACGQGDTTSINQYISSL